MPASVFEPRWIDLEGAANVRDLAGLPLDRGGVIASRRLIRSDNLQGLSARDVRALVDEHEVRAVADLRTDVEFVSEGPGPLTREAGVQFLRASLYIEDGTVTMRDTDAGPVILPWADRPRDDKQSASYIYQTYLTNRPDSVLGALRLIAHSEGATVVHCAAGKDRTGVVVALALDAVGVPRDAIVDDYARTAERLTPLLARLAGSPTYTHDTTPDRPERHAPRPATMRDFLEVMEAEHNGTITWLAAHGWTNADQQALIAKLTSQ
jgi:protein-tyrosine phosphatase